MPDFTPILTDAELATIEARAKRVQAMDLDRGLTTVIGCRGEQGQHSDDCLCGLVIDDIPRLLAEVRRLRSAGTPCCRYCERPAVSVSVEQVTLLSHVDPTPKDVAVAMAFCAGHLWMMVPDA